MSESELAEGLVLAADSAVTLQGMTEGPQGPQAVVLQGPSEVHVHDVQGDDGAQVLDLR